MLIDRDELLRELAKMYYVVSGDKSSAFILEEVRRIILRLTTYWNHEYQDNDAHDKDKLETIIVNTEDNIHKHLDAWMTLNHSVLTELKKINDRLDKMQHDIDVIDSMIGCAPWISAKVETNADRVRRMSDAELEHFLTKVSLCCQQGACDSCPIAAKNAGGYPYCNIKEWLQYPPCAKEDE